MKLTWPLGLTLFIGTYMAVMVFAVIRSTYHPENLVASNYYEQEIGYQKKIDKQKNAQALSEHIQFDVEHQSRKLVVQFPTGQIVSGNILLFRPSDDKWDRSIAIKTNDSLQQTISLADLPSGLWKVQVDWESGGTGYYEEKTIVLN